MAGFTFRLEHEDGTPADPPTLHTVVPTWTAGEMIPLGRGGALRDVEIRPGLDALRRCLVRQSIPKRGTQPSAAPWRSRCGRREPGSPRVAGRSLMGLPRAGSRETATFRDLRLGGLGFCRDQAEST
jgi:hypothetical protein